MAGMNRKLASSRSGSRRESFEETNQGESFLFNEQFMHDLRRLPDELLRLKRENNILKKESKALPTRDDLSSKRIEKWFKEKWETREKELKRQQEECVLQLRKHHEQLLSNSTEILQKNNTELQNRLKEREKENETLKRKVKECERQLQERVSIGSRYSRDTERFTYEQQLAKTKQELEEKRREFERFKERHAALSERRVRSDQRRTENTLSTNRQSQLESEYFSEFKDGTRVDAIDIITTRVGRLRGTKVTSLEYLKCCRLACFIFEIAYDVVVNVKESFAIFTSFVLEMLATDAASIGSDIKAFEDKLWKLRYNRPKVTLHATQDALGELMILVKEGAKAHDISALCQNVKSSIAIQWKRRRNLQQDQLPPDYDGILLHDLKDYIEYCTRFAWCAVTQVPPLKIDFSTATYSSMSHVVSQTLGFTDERSPTRRTVYPETRRIFCYLWPTLQDCDDKVIRKGEVILNH